MSPRTVKTPNHKSRIPNMRYRLTAYRKSLLVGEKMRFMTAGNGTANQHLEDEPEDGMVTAVDRKMFDRKFHYRQ